MIWPYAVHRPRFGGLEMRAQDLGAENGLLSQSRVFQMTTRLYTVRVGVRHCEILLDREETKSESQLGGSASTFHRAV